MDAQALKVSWARVVPLADTAAEIFYAALFTLDNSLRVMFPVGMGGQRDRLLAALGHVIANVDDAETVTRFVEQLGVDHRKFGVKPEHYPTVGQALLYTLEQGLGEEWTPELAEHWTAAYTFLADTMIQSARKHEATSPPWWNAEVLERDQRSGDITVLTIRPDLAGPPFYFAAGQSISIESHLRRNVWRLFSPANAWRRDGTIELHVRAVDGGQLSPALCYQAKPGDVLRLGPPMGEQLTVQPVLPPDQGPDLLMVSSGTGLAPLKAVVEQLAASLDTRHITLVHGARWRHDLYDLDQLNTLAEQYHRLTVIPALSQEPGSAAPATPVQAALRARDTWHNHDIYVCGSPAMVANTCSVLDGEGYDPSRIRLEPYDGTTYAPLQQGRYPQEASERMIRR